MKRSFLLAWMFVMLGTTAACNTTRGVGRDVEAAGDTIEDTADDAMDDEDDEDDDQM